MGTKRDFAWLCAYMLVMGITGAAIVIAAAYWSAHGVGL